MSEEKKIPVKTAKAPIRTERSMRRRSPLPSTHLLATLDDILEDFRRRFRESLWTPWEWADLEPYRVEFPIREAYTDLVDEGNQFIVRAEVPGIPKDKIDVTVTQDDIEISGETGAERKGTERNFVVRERSYSSVYKRLAFPAEVIPEKANAKIKDGVLEVSIPKKTPTPGVTKHKVEVKEAP